MDKKEAIMMAQQYVNVVRSKYPLVRALVFGSYAKGVHHANSDIDVAVVLKHANNLFDAQIALMRLRNGDDLLIEPHVFREKDFTDDNPLVYEILSSGVELSCPDTA
jgi:predicted nucleotidyltransferase